MGIVGIASRKAGADVTARRGGVRAHRARARRRLHQRRGTRSTGASVVRPETVINQLHRRAWEPLLQTPPFPEYTSGHSVISTAAAAVLTDAVRRRVRLRRLDGGRRTGSRCARFPSFDAAADEAAISRLYGGIHYRRAIEEGDGRGGGRAAASGARAHAGERAGCGDRGVGADAAPVDGATARRGRAAPSAAGRVLGADARRRLCARRRAPGERPAAGPPLFERLRAARDGRRVRATRCPRTRRSTS